MCEKSEVEICSGITVPSLLRGMQAVYNHWTGLVDWTGGLIQTVRKLVPMHEF